MRLWAGGIGALLLALPVAALAGPPYVTDDPEPTDTGHWENYHFAAAQGDEGEAGLDVNYGAAKDLQLTAVIPFQWEPGRTAGVGEIKLGGKYRFVHSVDGAAVPDIAIFPTVTLPTGRFTSGRASLFLPVWVQKDWGGWSVFGGGGYTWNPGGQNFWTSGIAVQRKITEVLRIGAESYREGAPSFDAHSLSGANLAVLLKVSRRWSLIASAGPQWDGSVQHAAGYIALKADF